MPKLLTDTSSFTEATPTSLLVTSAVDFSPFTFIEKRLKSLVGSVLALIFPNAAVKVGWISILPLAVVSDETLVVPDENIFLKKVTPASAL